MYAKITPRTITCICGKTFVTSHNKKLTCSAECQNLRREEMDQLNKYGVTRQQLFEKQRGLCALCHQPVKVGRRESAIDHDHETGKVRGLIHWSCNRLAIENTELLFQAAEYVESHRRIW